MRKSGKVRRKKSRHDVALFDNVEALFTGLSAFPNMATNVNIAMQQGKKRIDKMETLVDNDGVVFTWSVHISKYGN